MNRHQRRLRAKAKPVRLPPVWSDDYKVLRVLISQMPNVQKVAEAGQIDIMEATEGMLQLLELGCLRLTVCPDGTYDLVTVDGVEI